MEGDLTEGSSQPPRGLAVRFIEYFGAHLVPHRDEHERDRAFQRGCTSIAILLAWAVLFSGGGASGASRFGMFAFCVLFALTTFSYRAYLRRHPGSAVWVQYGYLLLDTPALLFVLVEDPLSFAFLYPFLLVVIVRCGIRFGVRTMWLVWGVTLVAAVILLPLSKFWRAETELSLSFGLMLTLVPVFFVSLIRRVHNVRQIEEERARLGAMHEVISARSTFLSKVSHELRSPLQGIVSALDVFEMRHARGIAEDDELIGRMRRSSMLLNTQLRDLLTLAKGEAGHLQMHPEPFDAAALVEGVALAARESAQAKGLDLRVEQPPGTTFVVADCSRIDQVLTNLVVNSVRYTHRGEVRLVLHPYEDAGKRLHFTVADTGPGIPEALLPSLLTPETLLAGSARRGEGSGIGLAVVRTLVDHLGGTVSVTSREGVGTTFEVHIPAERIDPEDSVADADDGSRTNRVLIVDDREDVLTGLTSVINELGYECDHASAAPMAANLLAARRYDAVLLDIQMPIKSGADIAMETRRGNGPNRATRLLGMSAAEVTAQYTDGPFDACLTKPIDRNALVSALREEWPESWPASTI